MELIILFVALVVGAGAGALFGLIPYFLAKGQGKPNMAQIALVLCTIGGLLAIAPLIAIGFSIAAFVSYNDMRPIRRRPQYFVPPAPAPDPAQYVYRGGNLALSCVSGPLSGRVYRIGSEGVLIGRSHDCAVHFSTNANGVSRHHCAIRWTQGGPALVDLGSRYGTFLSDGRQLPPNFPMGIAVGDRFYLANRGNQFEIVRM